MNANKNISLTLSNRLIKIVFLIFLSQQFSCITNTDSPKAVVDAAYFPFQVENIIPSCKDHGILAGESLEIDCVNYCYPNTMKSFDNSDIDEDSTYVIRNTVCRCYENGESPAAPKRLESECWTKAEVWDKTKPVMPCELEYKIVSMSTCQAYCKRIDPISFAYKGAKGSSICDCGGVRICNDKPSSKSAAATVTPTATTLSTVLTLVVGCVLTLLS